MGLVNEIGGFRKERKGFVKKKKKNVGGFRKERWGVIKCNWWICERTLVRLGKDVSVFFIIIIICV